MITKNTFAIFTNTFYLHVHENYENINFITTIGKYLIQYFCSKFTEFYKKYSNNINTFVDTVLYQKQMTEYGLDYTRH